MKFKSNNKKRTFTKSIPMRATLYYESGMPVEANDQDILKVKDHLKKKLVLC